MKRFLKLSYRLIGILFAVFLFAGQAYASATSGVIKGTAVDDGGLAIPGVLVTLSSPSLIGGGQQRTSDAEGGFIFAELPPGSYEMLAQKQGFSQVRKTGLEVSSGRTVQVTVEMKVGQEELVIEEQRKTVDTERASQGTVMNKDFLSRIPSGRSYQDVVSNTAGVIGGGNPNSAGASSNENTFLLDGVNVTDPVTGTFSTNFNFDAIEEIEVITGGFDPEYGESLGAVISVVTKSGGNTLEVITHADYENGDWGPRIDSRFAPDLGTLELSPTGFDFSTETGSLSTLVSGPVVKDRVWFLGGYQYTRTSYQLLGTPLPRDYDAHYFFGKLTFQPSTAHRFTLQLVTDPTTIDNIDQGSTRIEPEAFGRQAQGGTIYTAKWNWFINPEANLETFASFQKSWITLNTVPCTHDQTLGYNPCEPDELENTVDYDTPGRNGLYGAYSTDSWGYYYLDDRYRAELSSKFSLLQVELLGKHDFKVGIDANYLFWDQIQGYPGNLAFYDMYEQPYDPDSYIGLAWVEVSGPYESHLDGYHVGAFVQDVWKPIQNLTFRGGVRYDRNIIRDYKQDAIADTGLFGPRIYAVWDPWADEKSKIYGGYGRFNDGARLALASDFAQSYFGSKVIYGEYYDNYSSTYFWSAGDYDKKNTITALDGLTAPHSDEFKIGAQREIAPDISGGVEVTGKRTQYLWTYDETNLIYDEDGANYIGSGTGTLDIYYRLRTPAVSVRDYLQMDFRVDRVFADRWLFSGVYTYSVSRGVTQDTLGAQLSNPAQVELSYGNLDTDLRHQLKVQAAWDIPNDPWTTQLGARIEYYSGFPITRYYYSNADSIAAGGSSYSLLKEELGTYGRTDPVWVVDAKIEQAIPTVTKGKLSVVGTIQNITSNQYAEIYYGYYVSAENRYIIYYRESPISAELALEYEF